MTIEALKDWFEQTGKIIKDLHISLNNAKRLTISKYENEDWIKNHGFFRHHYYQLWFIMAIQLSKLLANSKNQKYNFNKLLVNLLKEDLDKGILQFINNNKSIPFSARFKSHEEMLDKIKYFQEEIKNKEVLISRIVKVRDTLYAHRDPNAILQELNLQDIDTLVSLCKNLYNCFRGGIFDINFDFSNNCDWDVDYILKCAALAKAKDKLK